MGLSKEFKQALNTLTTSVLTSITKEDVNSVRAGVGASFDYLPLDTLLKMVAKQGFVAVSTIKEGFMVTTLMHSEIEGELNTSIPTDSLQSLNDGSVANHNKKMQAYGLSFTYLRRYSLYNLLGVTMADVLEINEAKQQKSETKLQKPKNESVVVVSGDESAEELVKRLTSKQAPLKLHERYAIVKEILAKPDVTEAHFNTILDGLKNIKKYLIEKSLDTEKVDNFIGILEEKIMRAE